MFSSSNGTKINEDNAPRTGTEKALENITETRFVRVTRCGKINFGLKPVLILMAGDKMIVSLPAAQKAEPILLILLEPAGFRVGSLRSSTTASSR